MRSQLRRAAIAIAVATLAAGPIVAQGSSSGLAPVEGLENWKYHFDLGAYKDGEYNLIVEGKDKAGNVTRSSPLNIYVDPKSDLPIVSVINPVPLMRVGGDLNIVGTCVDDDGVDHVEVRLDGGEWTRAEGREFWSLYLKTAEIPEGRRALDVRGVDINGLTGPAVRVKFDLDRTKPLTSVVAPPNGTLVSGQISLSGTIFDANGVRSLEISQDGATWKPVPLSRDKDETRARFAWPVDTKKLGDGPKVFRLRGVDMVGSSSIAAYLLFVDNTKPAIEIASPVSGSSVNGLFTIVGAVRDTVGVKSLGYELGTVEKGEIPLTKGDPYFAKELDSYKIKGDQAVVTLMAEDSIGNVTRQSWTYKIDRKADKPVLTVLGPKPSEGKRGSASRATLLRQDDIVWGSIADDDGVQAIRWSLDRGQPTEVPCSEVFSLAMPAVSSGPHVLTLVPVDSNGLAGDAVDLPISFDAGPASVSFDSLAGVKDSRPFSPGADVRVDGGEALVGTVIAPNPVVSAAYSVAGAAPKPLALTQSRGGSAGAWRFSVAIDRSWPFGFAPITVTVKDDEGGSYEGRALLYVADYGSAREETGFRFSDPRIAEDGRAVFGPKGWGGDYEPILGTFYGGQLSSVRLDPPTDLVAASFDGRVVSLRPEKEGSTKPTKLVGTTDRGHEFSAGPFVFVTDSTPPELAVDSSAEGAWIKGDATIVGKVSDSGGEIALSWRVLPDGAPTAAAAKADGSFSIPISASSLPQGSVSIEIEARDAAGNVSRAYRSIGADSQPPEARFLSPEPGQTVWGPEDVAASVDDTSGLASVEFAPDGATFAPIEWKGRYFVHRADLAANPKAVYRLTDKAGNVAITRPEVSIGSAPARILASPIVSVEPAPGEARVELSGSSGPLKASLLLPGLPIETYAALGDSSSMPSARFATHLLVPGNLSLKGQASSESPIKAVWLSLDGGATYTILASVKDEKSSKGPLAFMLSVEAAKLPTGAARWDLKLEDFSGATFVCPLYLLVDQKPPTLAVLFPEAGTAAMPGPFPLVVKAEDENGLALAEFSAGTATAKESLGAEAGGRYFARMIDPAPTGAKGSTTISLNLSVRDAFGNRASVSPKYAYDAASDAPKIVLSSPEDKESLDSGALCLGSASDDDGPPLLKVSIDGGEPREFAAGSFALALHDLAAGKHSIAVSAGSPASGESSLKRDFSVRGPAPLVGELKIGVPKSLAPLIPGGDYELGPGALVSGSVESANGLTSLTVSVNAGPPAAATIAKAVKGGAYFFSFPLPAFLPYDRASLEIVAKDGPGLAKTLRLELHKVIAAAAGSDVAEAIRFFDRRIVAEGDSSRFLIGLGERLEGRFNGRPIASIAVEPPTPSLKAAFEGGELSIEGAAEGLVGPSRLVLTTVDGDRFSWGPFSAAVDSDDPSLEISAPVDDEWHRGEVRVEGVASDPRGLASVDASVDDLPPTRLYPKEGQAGGSAQIALGFSLDLSAAPDGATRIDFVAKDMAGREKRVSRFINKDTQPPILTQVEPHEGESVNGLTTFAVSASDAGRLASTSFLADPKAAPQEVSGLSTMTRDLDLVHLALPLPEGGGFMATDRAGNVAVFAPSVVVDKEKDKPIAEIDTPSEMEVLRGDFVIGGVAYDDDGLAAAYYRIDGGEWSKLEMTGTSFSIPVALKDTTDNEHLVEVKAEDIYGVQGDIASRKYRISKEEPVAAMTEPPISKTVRGTVELAGSASDANGIKEITVSVDNRTSYNRPVGTTSWKMSLDTTTLSDGIHAVAVKPVDGYDTEGFYASMISVDNTPPQATMDLPLDGQEAAGTLLVSGRVSDNVAVASSRIEVSPIGAGLAPAIAVDLGGENIVKREFDISSLKPGAYVVRIVVLDRAENSSLASRDIVVTGPAPVDSVSIVYPIEGQRASGKLVVQGKASIASGASSVSILADGLPLGDAACDGLGWYSFDLPEGSLADGAHVLKVSAAGSDGRRVESPGTRLEWQALGPWVSIDSIASGKYLPYRPFLKGNAGWTAEPAPEGDKKAFEEYKKLAKSREVKSVEVSLDDGRSYEKAKGAEKWSFRLETQDYKEGALRAIVRATYADGSVAVAKGMYFLDKTPPVVEIIDPPEGGRFNQVLAVSGRASDENGLDSVGVALRKGDKSMYEVPSFIQGLYVDGQGLGASLWQAGLGLTFFSDNVKLEGFYGQAPKANSSGEAESFYGDVFGAKLIANLFYLPFSSIFGPDLDFLSAAFGLGANFTYFTKTQADTGLVVSSVFAQLEFPKLTAKSWSAFKKFSLYTEFQLWVLSSVVEGGFIPKMSFGGRIGVF